MSRLQLLRKLVTTFHLNVPERRSLGGPVTRSEIIEMILAVLAQDGFYPPHVRPWTPGTGIYEGTILEMLPDGRCRSHCQAATAYAGYPEKLTARDFPDGRTAVGRLIATDFEHGIDGIPFV